MKATESSPTACLPSSNRNWLDVPLLTSCALRNGADDAWESANAPYLCGVSISTIRALTEFSEETHELATWVVNQDELLDRKLLEARHVKVIRYIQSATQGRNLDNFL